MILPPVWSRDGKTLAFLSSRNGDSQVYLLSMDGGEAHATDETLDRRGHREVGRRMESWLRSLHPCIPIRKTTSATRNATRKKKKIK